MECIDGSVNNLPIIYEITVAWLIFTHSVTPRCQMISLQVSSAKRVSSRVEVVAILLLGCIWELSTWLVASKRRVTLMSCIWVKQRGSHVSRASKESRTFPITSLAHSWFFLMLVFIRYGLLCISHILIAAKLLYLA